MILSGYKSIRPGYIGFQSVQIGCVEFRRSSSLLSRRERGRGRGRQRVGDHLQLTTTRGQTTGATTTLVRMRGERDIGQRICEREEGERERDRSS